MNESFEQFNSSWNNERLDPHEKAIIRARIQNYMAHMPVPSTIVPHVSAWSIVSAFRDFQFKVVPIALVTVLVLSSAVSAAAEETVPGDVLYFIKTSVNEGVKGALAISNESEVRFHVEVAERRLEETEQLAVENRLTPEVTADLNTRFSKHAANVKEGVKKLEEDDNLEAAISIASDFESSLTAHKTAFEKIAAAETTPQPGLENVTLAVTAEVATVASVRKNVEEKVKMEVRPSRAKKSAAESKRTLESLFAALGELLTPEPTSEPVETEVITVATTSATTTPVASTIEVAEPITHMTLTGIIEGESIDVITLATTSATTTPVASTTGFVIPSTEHASADVTVKVQAATSAYNQGIEKLSDQKYGAAFVEFERAKRLLEEAKTAVVADKKLPSAAE